MRKKCTSIGIAAGGLLRLLLPSKTYAACKGGATLLAADVTSNVTSVAGSVYTADYVRFWQVCTDKKYFNQ